MNETGWHVRLIPSALHDLRRLEPPVPQRILAALDGLTTQPPTGDIKRLAEARPEWRLRIGDLRVRFTRDTATQPVLIRRVLPRGRACRD